MEKKKVLSVFMMVCLSLSRMPQLVFKFTFLIIVCSPALDKRVINSFCSLYVLLSLSSCVYMETLTRTHRRNEASSNVPYTREIISDLL